MIERKSWKEFKDNGFLWLINNILHLFGWAILFEYEDGKILDVYPAIVKFRGFPENSNSKGYRNVSHWLKENIDNLCDEADDV